jgi:hypothetical protein
VSAPGSTKRRHHHKPRNAREVCRRSGGKLRFSSRKRALTILNMVASDAERAGASSVPTGVYECRFCGDWHLTSKAAAWSRGRGRTGR